MCGTFSAHDDDSRVAPRDRGTRGEPVRRQKGARTVAHLE